jgi:hypothetical protein
VASCQFVLTSFFLCLCGEKGFPNDMVEELEQEYAALKDKVRDLQEYL